MKLQIIVFLQVAVLICSSPSSVFGEDPLEVALYYESYCPDSVQYVNEQLLKVYNLFVDHLQLALIPYGKAYQKFVDGRWVFHCQHGPRECVGNKLHACAIYQACGDSGTVSCPVSKINQVLKYISCVMNQDDQLQATAQCAKTAKLDANDIISCMNGDKGEELLNFYGNQTEKIVAWLTYVPCVAVNGKHDTAAQKNLMDRLCQLKPEVCKHSSTEEPEVLLV